MRTEYQGTRNNGQGPAWRRPSSRGSIPAYILFPAGFFGGSIVFTYWYFQDEAPFTKRRRILATVSFLSFIGKVVYVCIQLVLCSYNNSTTTTPVSRVTYCIWCNIVIYLLDRLMIFLLLVIIIFCFSANCSFSWHTHCTIHLLHAYNN